MIIASITIAITVYLFATAPPPLAAEAPETRTVPIRAVFSILETENDAAREMWTKEIVTQGTAVGLAFDESWRDERVHAGPLPALFLRETANALERHALRLRLFLGSRFPINPANQFIGEQAKHFAAVEETGAPQFFLEPTTKLHTAMFTDRAVVEACVSCHNQHADSPKRDWKLHAIMGATTWMYPDDAVTVERAIELIGALRTSTRAAYAAYLQKVATFPARPEIGARWPRDGFYLPTEDVFMSELARRTSSSTILGLIDPHSAELAAAAPEVPPEPPTPRVIAKPDHPMLVIRSANKTMVHVEHERREVMVVVLPAGGGTSLTSRPPLRVRISNPAGVQLEYGGKPIELPELADDAEEVEITLGARVAEKSPS